MSLPDDLLKRIAHSMEEEEVDIYMLTLYSLNSDDINYFGDADREKVRRIFKILIEDTKRHSELLKLIVEMGGHRP